MQKHLDDMNPKHLGLAHDVIDLAKTTQMLNTNINLLEAQKMANLLWGIY